MRYRKDSKHQQMFDFSMFIHLLTDDIKINQKVYFNYFSNPSPSSQICKITGNFLI